MKEDSFVYVSLGVQNLFSKICNAMGCADSVGTVEHPINEDKAVRAPNGG